MTGRVAHIWRHPIKSHGREALDEVTLEAGRTMPWDRTWAVIHDAARYDTETPQWAPSAQFSRCAKTASLQAITARLDEAARRVTLAHPDRPDLTIAPDDPADNARFIDWVTPLCDPQRALPARIVQAPGRGMTDTDFPSISLINLASHRALSQRLGREISPLRWRGNLILDGLGPWEEFEWIGRTLRIGTAELTVRERTVRCLATTASTRTGKRDADTLGTLEAGWGHRDFGVYAEVTAPGRIATGDTVEPL
ncbi:molybdenum cofactor biosysynthesis protein [Maritimibacter sp. 55A14]|uniref:MOSC domain-containing protein n=1 Tax=Maritimibacter sp. 55A14 TaxID=2174844 RepID=UPI000D61156B|nr:MOSC domain-containing protein [Maritimibacter sp. 55A14]PWE32733.1 molybdenum cofactor biosysynthesis protein [Maritimibacter sp. 55A14]